MTKTLKLITVQGYLVAVSDATPSEGALVVHEDENGCHELMYCNNRTGHGLKIEGYLPLEENLPPLKGIEFLPPLEQDNVIGFPLVQYIHEKHSQERVAGFCDGYLKAKENYKYTDEDMYMLAAFVTDFIAGRKGDFMTTTPKNVADKFIQSLSQPKIPIAFECGVEELFAEDGKTKIGEDLAVEIIEGFTAYLSGKYIYE